MTTQNGFRFFRFIAASLVLVGLCSCGTEPDGTLSSVLHTAINDIDSSSTLHMSFSTMDEPPLSEVGTVSGEGSFIRPNSFTGSFIVSVVGIPTTVSIVIIHGKSYLKAPLSPSFTPGSAAQYGFPNPLGLFSATTGIPSLLSIASHLAYRGNVVIDSHSDWAISGLIPDRYLANTLDTPSTNKMVSITFDIDEKTHHLSSMTIIAPFFVASTNATFTITINEYNSHVHLPRVGQ